ncbi:hypothetical protein B0H19DRAFT_1263804 [Mycena capillaripes]|nr:hypothetical protein B0H19DRAFT_1263804 [Mycena capillaripes]
MLLNPRSLSRRDPDARRTYGERFGASARSSTPWKHPEDGDEIWGVEQTREERTASASAHLPGPQRRGWLEDGVKSGTRLEVEVVAKRKTLVIFVNSLKCVSVLTPLPLLNDDDSHHLCPPASLRPSPPLLYADDSHHLCPPDPPPRTPLHLSPACPERIGARQRRVGFGGTVLLTPRWDLRHIPPRTPPPVLSTPALERVGARPRLVGPNAWARGGVASGLCSDTASRKLADASCATPLNLSPPCRERVGAQRLALGLCQDTPSPKTLPPLSRCSRAPPPPNTSVRGLGPSGLGEETPSRKISSSPTPLLLRPPAPERVGVRRRCVGILARRSPFEIFLLAVPRQF